MIMGFFLSSCLLPPFIHWMKNTCKKTQPIRKDGPSHHLVLKHGTPTMGGVVILLSLVFTTLCWARPLMCVWFVVGVGAVFGMIGGVDDYLKITQRHTQGLSGKSRVMLQAAAGTGAFGVFFALMPPHLATGVFVPFFHTLIPLSWGFLGWFVLVLIATSNSVNLTDGLDGLLVGPLLCVLGFGAVIVCSKGGLGMQNQGALSTLVSHDIHELLIVIAATMGALLGFLWHNAPPAHIFMGDTGSLALGGLVAALFLLLKQEIFLLSVGGVFVAEALSVIVQVFYYKRTKKRFFLMAPFHHHFEKKGLSETSIVFRFWIVSFILFVLSIWLFFGATC